MTQSTITAPGVKLILNGTIVGFATAISWTRTQNVVPVMEIDNMFPAEVHPTSYQITGTLSGIRVREIDGLDNFGIMDISNPQNIFSQQYVKLEIVDRVTDKRLYTLDRIMFSADSWQVANKGIMTFQANFVGFFLSNSLTTTS